MDFTHEFRVSLPIESAWELFTDVPRLAPCMPGAQLTDVEGEKYHGTVKVKVGPVTTQYKGTATFEERDESARTVRIKATGRDTRGQGNADAHITARLAPDGDGTRVTVQTRLTITGKAAQFGKGVMEEISRKLLGQFVDCLERQLAAERTPAQEESVELPGEVTAQAAQAAAIDDEPLDLLDVAGNAVLKRLIPVAVGVVVLLAVVLRLRKALGRHRS
ncbi:SRPBCC family protein [Streptacidiphilus anmyonensis]|uniref:SRPBCC family protein n=1 Tax=Streptacidiphilus anmyonensis TaxID=405782 RepID=UPI0005AB5EA8|nr:SRPBCC family protein [Streptacidiphilus anmyonensis]